MNEGSPASATASRIPVVIASFPDGIGGPQQWLKEILPRLRSSPLLEVETWYPSGHYQGLFGKIRLFGQVRKRFAGQHHKVVYLSLDLDLAAQLLACLRLVGVSRIVVHSHAARFRIRNALLQRAYRFLVRWANAWVGVSDQAGAAMFGTNFQSRGRIIPTSIDFVGMLERADAEHCDSLETIDRPHSGRVFAFVGRLAREKCADVAVELFASHLAEFPEDRLLIVGDGPERARLENLAAGLLPADSFKFMGNIGNVGRLLNNDIDCILIPSSFEGQCRVSAEAQFFGVTVIASDALPDVAFLDPSLAIRILNKDFEQWQVAMAGVQGKNCAADMSRARQLEREATIGMLHVAEQFEQVVLEVAR